MPATTFADILKFNPYHDSKGRFASADAATSFTYAPGKSTAHDAAIQRAKDAHEAASGKGFKGTLYHGSPAKDIEEFDMSRAGANTSSGEKLLFFTDSKQLAEDFSYERLEGSTKYFQRRGEKGRVYEVDVEMKNPLDFRNLSDKDIDNILKLDIEGVLTKEDVLSLSGNHQLLKTNLDLRAESLKKLGYDGLIANTGKAGHYALEYAVVDSKQATIRKGAIMKAMTFDDILKFNPYHDSRGRFSTADAATQFTIRTRDPGKQHLAEGGIRREKERDAAEAAAGSKETPQMKVIHDIEDKIRNQDYESAACVDKDGNVLIFKDGEESQVAFTQEECKLMAGNVLTHNHPSSTSFSVEDVDCWLANDMQEIRATNRLGITYSLSRGENFDKSIGENFAVAFHINRNKALREAQQTLDDKGYPAKIARGEISIDQANAEFRDIFNTVMVDFCTKRAPSYGINFSVEKREITKSAGTFVYHRRYEEATKAADDGKPAWILDKDSEAEIDAAFNEWLSRAKKQSPTKTEKSFDTITEVNKFNPYHDQTGRFATADGATVFTYAPGKSKAHDNAITREKERQAAGGSAYEKALDEEQAKVLAMKPNEQALYVFEHDGETEDNCLAAMNNGETEALVKNYFAVMRANGDPTPTNPTSEQVKNQLKDEVEYGRKYQGYEEARIDYIQKMTGMDAEEAAATMQEFNKWFGGSWGSADTATLDNYVSKDHVYDGKMYRGMKFTPEGFDSFMENISPGATISMKRNSSWSSDEAVARSFAGHASDVVFSVMVTCVKNRTSAPVDHLSTAAESEVLAHSNAKWTVLHSEVVTWPSGAKKAYLTVVETGE